MDSKRLILSVAGSGKTTHIINSLNADNRALILTYTDNNYENLRLKVAEKFGHIPDNILIMTYFEFLYSFCYRPFLHRIVGANGYNFSTSPRFTTQLKRTNMKYYLDQSNCLYHNRLAKLLKVKGIIPKINERVKKYFDEIYIDEVQDFGGHDFNLLIALSQTQSNVMFVGDFFQHTFDTSRDGNVNSSLHDDYEKFVKRFIDIGFSVDNDTLCKSHRCSKSICKFVNDQLGISINSYSEIDTDVILVEDQKVIDEIMNNSEIIKLFLQNSTKYCCYSSNWGASKGQDCHTDVCVVLNAKTYSEYKKNQLHQMNTQTRNKFYVACTRARRKLIFIPEKAVKAYKK